jgi:hypothetical protein
MRRFPFPALLACTTCVVLLVGCESPVAFQQTTPSTPSRPPTEQSLSFEIAGPSQIDADGTFSWEAFAFGGSGQYQYRWEVTRQAGQQPTTTTTGRGLSLHVTDTDGDIVLRLTVTSGTQTRVESLAVRNCIGGCR